MEKLQGGALQFEESLGNYDLLNRIQEKFPVRIPKTLFAVVFCLGSFTVLYFTVGPGLLTNLFGFFFPAYASFKAIESVEKEDDTQWLMYWVVFSFFSLFETFADILSEYVPMYFALKLALLVWLSAPGTRGAEFVYVNVLRQFLLDNEVEIDRGLAKGKEIATEIASATKEVAMEKVEVAKDHAEQIVKQVEATLE